MVRHLDIASWKRREHFAFFKDSAQPFFNVCTEVEVTALVQATTSPARSFFLASLYASLRAVNSVEALRLRIRGDDVIEHDIVHGGSTVLRPDSTFGFGYFDYGEDFARFESEGHDELARVRRERTLDPRPERDDQVFYSVLPWISFTSFAHARTCAPLDSNPRIVFGKRSGSLGGSYRMPVSVEVHHALVDGLHVGDFLTEFQRLLDRPGDWLGD